MEKKLSLIKQIPAGYKKSELGVIPEDWDVNVVEDIADVKSGKRLPLGRYLIDSETNHPYIRVTDMFQGGVSLSEIKYVPEDVFPAIQNYKIFKDDIFISVAGTLGIVGKIPVKLDGANLTENADRLTNITCDRDYLLYVFTSPLIQGIIESERTLGAQPKLALTRIRKFKVVLPNDKTEQIAIATVLSDTDALIEQLEKLIVKKKAIKQGAMQQLLTGKKRLPGFSGKWDVRKLGEIFSLTATYSKSNFIDSGGNYLIMDMGSVSSVGQMIASKRTFLSVDPLRIGDLVMPKDDIGGGNIIGKVAYIDQDNKYVLGDHVYKLTAINSKTNTLFFSYLINSNIINSELKKKVSGTAQLGLGRKSVEEQDVKIPKDKEEQNAIATVLSDMDAEIESLEKKRDKYIMLKQGTMQQLLTGRIRIYDNN